MKINWYVVINRLFQCNSHVCSFQVKEFGIFVLVKTGQVHVGRRNFIKQYYGNCDTFIRNWRFLCKIFLYQHMLAWVQNY